MKTEVTTRTPRSITPTTLEQIWNLAKLAVGKLQSDFGYHRVHSERFSDVRVAMDRLPISQDEFALANLRLDNAVVSKNSAERISL